MMAERGLLVVRRGGSRLNYRKAVFSADGKNLLCVSGDLIKVFRTATQKCIHVLQGHSDLVTGIELNPKNHLQLYSCSLDGTVKLWDFMDGFLIKNYLIGFKFCGFYTAIKENYVYAILPKNNEVSDTYQLVSVMLAKSTDPETKEISVIFEDVSQSTKCTAVGRDGEYIATVKGLSLLVYFFRQKRCFRFTLSAASKKGINNVFTVVKCHPKEDCIATGHEDGKIRLWRNFDHKQEYTFSTLHWHHDAVADLAFSIQGTVLFSGGVESVLVQWFLSFEHKKEFLPRLGAAIEYISTSPDGSVYCTSHKDNQMTIIEVGLKVIGIIQGLVKGNCTKTAMIQDPRSKSLVLNGKPGHLQFYSLHDDQQLYNLDIVQQEFVHQSGLQYTDVVNAAFSSDGHWLATVEELQGKKTNIPNVHMKLWEFQSHLQSFVLNTTIRKPHEGQITSLVFQNRGDTGKDNLNLVTTGTDGFFKVWMLRNRQSIGWSCDFVGSYHTKKAVDCCFCDDDSLLAVGFEEVITIWEVNKWTLKTTLCQPPGKIRSLCFGRLSCSKYLLASTDSGFINCWNVLKCALKWRSQIDAIVLQPDVLSENIAAFTFSSGCSNLFIFNPSDPMPLYVHEEVCQGKVLLALFAPRIVPEAISSVSHRWLKKCQLYFLTETQDLLSFIVKTPEESFKPLGTQLAVEECLPSSLFYSFGTKQQDRQVKLCMELEKAYFFDYKIQTPTVKELLHAPAHVLPPASILCSLFLNLLLVSKKSESTEPVATDAEMESLNEDTKSNLCNIKVNSDHLSTAFNNLLRTCTEKELSSMRKTEFNWVSS